MLKKARLIDILQVQGNEDVSEIYVVRGVEDQGVLPKEESICHVVPEEQIGDLMYRKNRLFSNF